MLVYFGLILIVNEFQISIASLLHVFNRGSVIESIINSLIRAQLAAAFDT